MTKTKKWGLFSRFGIEIEYMICDNETLAVRPISDLLLKELSGKIQNEVSLGSIAVSNELALHVIELKTDDVLTSLDNAPKYFQEVVTLLNEKASKYGARLVPTGMHPFMNPLLETKLWEHEYNPIYEAYNRIFNCSGHGWANLQSTHLNLPFASEKEFVLLHRAIRLLLPLFPALSASSPVVDGVKTGSLDSRLLVYRNNQKKIPSIGGKTVPEDIHSFEEYRKFILEPMWRDIAPHDPEKLLREEWLNSRGAIARFERDAIEIRVLDTQESPLHDAAVLSAIVSMLKSMVERCEKDAALGKDIATEDLSNLFFDVAHRGPNAMVSTSNYLSLFGRREPCSVRDILVELLQPLMKSNKQLATILHSGPLAARLNTSLEKGTSRENLVTAWRRLSDCLAHGETFDEKTVFAHV